MILQIPEKEEDSGKPVAMSAIGKTLSFPRKDNIYKGKESIPYDEIQTQVWRDRPRGNNEKTRQWKAYMFLGIIIGTIAFAMAKVEDFLAEHIVHHA